MFGKERFVLLLSELLKDWPCTVAGGAFRVNVTGVTENAAQVEQGNIFVARQGSKEDGAFYIDDAINNGAAAIVVDRHGLSSIRSTIPVVTVPNCSAFLSHASAELSGRPSEKMTVIAVTGTNGKTTVSHFIGQLLNKLGKSTVIIGTTGIFIDGQKIHYEAPQMTTLPANYLHPLLKKCLNKGVTHVVLEASSLGLSTRRLDHCEIDIGIFLNIGVDHYDEHGSKERYIDAKKKLVEMANHLIVNRDDEVCVQLVKSSAKSCTYFGTKSAADVHLQALGDGLHVQVGEERGELLLSVLGEFNYLNALCAIATLQKFGYPLADLLPHTTALELPEGRMQCLERDGVNVVVDYAHTPEALNAVLQSLTRSCKGRIITVFGCGGDRDKGKRKEMGELAIYYSSVVIVTSDNPRSEDPQMIVADILTGYNEDFKKIKVELDRALAIQQAISMAKPNDIVIIAGKGHEQTQHTADGVIPFSDVRVAERALARMKWQ